MKQLLILSVLSISFNIQAQDWEMVKETSEMQVYVRKAEDSKLKEVKINSSISCPMSELVMALEDVESHKDWVKSTIDSKYVEKTDAANFYYYISTDMPYPVKDRDVVIKYNRSQDPNSKVVTNSYKGVADKMEPQKKFIRIPFFEAGYTLVPSAGGKIDLEYLFKVDVGGTMPTWIVNMALTKGPVDTIESLFELIRSGHYKGIAVEGITEL